jgi:hypothetical protein
MITNRIKTEADPTLEMACTSHILHNNDNVQRRVPIINQSVKNI